MVLDNYLTLLQSESYRPSILKRNRTHKTKSTAGVIANSLAKKQNDPLYKRMKFYRSLYMKTKEQIQRKYKSKSMNLARQRASNYK